MTQLSYRILPAVAPPDLSATWDAACWRAADTAQITNFRAESSDHRPRVAVRVLYDKTGLYGIFEVADRYVVSRNTEYQSSVCHDSCVEFFFQPRGEAPYFNLEMNCGGTILIFYVVDPSRTDAGFRDCRPVAPEHGRLITVRSSMPAVVDPELSEPTNWQLAFHLPWAALSPYAGEVVPAPGDIWRGNFYKCADRSSHPHWGAWAPVERLNFHLPHCFAPLHFG